LLLTKELIPFLQKKKELIPLKKIISTDKNVKILLIYNFLSHKLCY